MVMFHGTARQQVRRRRVVDARLDQLQLCAAIRNGVEANGVWTGRGAKMAPFGPVINTVAGVQRACDVTRVNVEPCRTGVQREGGVERDQETIVAGATPRSTSLETRSP